MNYDLLQHIKYVHEKIKPFKCNFCEKGFVRNRAMKNHEKNVHKKFNDSDVFAKDEKWNESDVSTQDIQMKIFQIKAQQ